MGRSPEREAEEAADMIPPAPPPPSLHSRAHSTADSITSSAKSSGRAVSVTDSEDFDELHTVCKGSPSVKVEHEPEFDDLFTSSCAACGEVIRWYRDESTLGVCNHTFHRKCLLANKRCIQCASSCASTPNTPTAALQALSLASPAPSVRSIPSLLVSAGASDSAHSTPVDSPANSPAIHSHSFPSTPHHQSAAAAAAAVAASFMSVHAPSTGSSSSLFVGSSMESELESGSKRRKLAPSESAGNLCLSRLPLDTDSNGLPVYTTPSTVSVPSPAAQSNILIHPGTLPSNVSILPFQQLSQLARFFNPLSYPMLANATNANATNATAAAAAAAVATSTNLPLNAAPTNGYALSPELQSNALLALQQHLQQQQQALGSSSNNSTSFPSVVSFVPMPTMVHPQFLSQYTADGLGGLSIKQQSVLNPISALSVQQQSSPARKSRTLPRRVVRLRSPLRSSDSKEDDAAYQCPTADPLGRTGPIHGRVLGWAPRVRTGVAARGPNLTKTKRREGNHKRRRERSAEIGELEFEHYLIEPDDDVNPHRTIRCWINCKHMKFYDCECGRRKPVQDLNKIKKHAERPHCHLSDEIEFTSV